MLVPPGRWLGWANVGIEMTRRAAAGDDLPKRRFLDPTPIEPPRTATVKDAGTLTVVLGRANWLGPKVGIGFRDG
jgi:hypothetical protein